jgi:hypothetical protein
MTEDDAAGISDFCLVTPLDVRLEYEVRTGVVRAPSSRAGRQTAAQRGRRVQQPGSRKLAIRVCQPAVLDAWPAAV